MSGILLCACPASLDSCSSTREAMRIPPHHQRVRELLVGECSEPARHCARGAHMRMHRHHPPPRPAPPPWAASTPPAPLPREASRAGGARPSTRVRPWPSMAHAHRAEPPARAAGHATLIAGARLAPPPCLATSLVATTAVPLQPRARCSEHPRRDAQMAADACAPSCAVTQITSRGSPSFVSPCIPPGMPACRREGRAPARPPPPAGQGRVRPTPSADCQGEPRLLGRRGGGHVRPPLGRGGGSCT